MYAEARREPKPSSRHFAGGNPSGARITERHRKFNPDDYPETGEASLKEGGRVPQFIFAAFPLIRATPGTLFSTTNHKCCKNYTRSAANSIGSKEDGKSKYLKLSTKSCGFDEEM